MYGLPLVALRVVPAQTNLTSCPQPETAVKWIFDAFHQCIYNFKAEVGLCIGLLSICCWMSAGFPQVVANFKTKKVHEAWSIYSLLLWLCGDSCNLIGCLLVHQLPVQVYTSFYYVGMDFIIISQYIYCYWLHRNQRAPTPSISIFEGAANQPWSPRTHRRGTLIVTCLFTGLFVPLRCFSNLVVTDDGSVLRDVDGETRFSSRSLLELRSSTSTHNSSSNVWTSQLVAGYSIGCISAVLYLASRVPQILKNFRRKKTDGVCYTLFLLAALGNSLYGTSILLQDPPFGMTRSEFLIRQAPWLVGSLGTMGLDSFIISQIFYYTRRQKQLVINGLLVEDGNITTVNGEYETIPDVKGSETTSDKQPLIDSADQTTRSNNANTTGYQSAS